MGVGIGAYSGVFMFVFVCVFFSNTRKNCTSFMLTIETWSKYCWTACIHGLHYKSLSPGVPDPAMVKAAPARLPPAWSAVPKACVHERQIFSWKDSKIIATRLIRRKDSKSGIKDAVVCVTWKRMFWTLPIALLPATFHVVKASLATPFFPRENELISLGKWGCQTSP